MFLQWGFKIELNNESVKPVNVEVLVSPREDGPAPYVFRRTAGDVTVSITVGLNTSRRSKRETMVTMTRTSRVSARRQRRAGRFSATTVRS